MFQFTGFPRHGLCVHPRVMEGHSTGFPHSDIVGLTPAHGSPMLFAVCHVLRRLLTPRHSPFAFSGLTYHAETALSLEQFFRTAWGLLHVLGLENTRTLATSLLYAFCALSIQLLRYRVRITAHRAVNWPLALPTARVPGNEWGRALACRSPR